MAHNFGSLIFTPAIKALPEKYASRRQYAGMEQSGSSDRLSPDEIAFLVILCEDETLSVDHEWGTTGELYFDATFT
jgi:hypothetical protein